MKRAVLLAVVAGMIGGCSSATTATSDRKTATISRATFQGDWPFTVPTGTLGCEPAGSPLGAVTFATGGKVYAVNGIALDGHYADMAPIWRRDPSGVFPKVNIGAVLEAGLRLCGGGPRG